ncbi:hypothetical protein JVT61DRAFT_5066 [Boletus reticuloceps]|uniref:Uncharacterized protein n=1 Tax=Boletus reticuloceps TaxID=495285 RepID=A0A8I2YWP3_9AGAM|nr:hypothetical protein JVT61DRAFT_12362 [Boletus reticuloceps]KAG6380689.1 hypothetical protein JVT61DRAFT_5066 [Boletus reticuloceps]
MPPKRIRNRGGQSSPYNLRSRAEKHTTKSSLSTSPSRPSAFSGFSQSLSPDSPMTELSVTPPPEQRDFDQAVQGVHNDLDSICVLYRRAVRRLKESDVGLQLAAQRKEIVQLQGAVKTLDDGREEAARVRNEAIACKVCMNPTDRPFMYVTDFFFLFSFFPFYFIFPSVLLTASHYSVNECGHLCCLRCLRHAFQLKLRADIHDKHIPSHLQAYKEPPYTAETLTNFFAAGLLRLTWYLCPVPNCGKTVWDRPSEVPYLTRLITSLSGSPLRALVPSTTVMDYENDPWAGVFCNHNIQ